MSERQADTASPPRVVHGGHPQARYDFSISTNPYGPPASLLDALRKTAVDRYIDDDGWRPVGSGLAEVDGAGTTELIYRIARTLAGPGDAAIVAGPTFGEYERASRLAGCRVVAIDRDDAGAGALPGDTRLVWLCQPNNPDGTLLKRAALADLLAACRARGAVLVVDAAFAPLCREPVPLPQPADDVIVLHSPTKIYGVPGIRYGYGETGHRTAARLAAAAPPWSLGADARALRAWMEQPDARRFVAATVPRHLEDARALQDALSACGWPVRPSATGFFTIETRRAHALADAALADGLALRTLDSFGRTGLRIAARRPEANQALLEWLRQRPGR